VVGGRIIEMKKLKLKDFKILDEQDPLFKIRDEFILPSKLIYFDGNSLGPLPKQTINMLDSMIQKEWGNGLISSWNKENWINMPRDLGNKIAPLIGAKKGEVVVVDSTSINLFKVLSSALLLKKNRKIIVSEAENFPSDLYILEGVKKIFGKSYKIQLIKEGDYKIENHINFSTAVVVLSHINYKTGRINDIKKITRVAHEKGALVIWDLSHSVGVMPIHLHNCCVDFAVGSTYKHLNCGPGSPSFLFVNESLIEKVSQPLTGWMGHIQPFEFSSKYQSANDIGKYICGTPSIIAYKAIQSALKVFDKVSLKIVREKSIKLSEMFIKLMDQECIEFDFTLISPLKNQDRGSQVSFTHSKGFSIMQTLISRGIIGDFREPNILRFGLSPLYMRFENIWKAVLCLRKIMQTKEWESKKFNKKKGIVT
jgi:kynureninase|tara:strand:+ start:242 stop:1516 length:1275 start_codon:yes stop_codon:yes gene_type:complete